MWPPIVYVDQRVVETQPLESCHRSPGGVGEKCKGVADAPASNCSRRRRRRRGCGGPRTRPPHPPPPPAPHRFRSKKTSLESRSGSAGVNGLASGPRRTRRRCGSASSSAKWSTPVDDAEPYGGGGPLRHATNHQFISWGVGAGGWGWNRWSAAPIKSRRFFFVGRSRPSHQSFKRR